MGALCSKEELRETKVDVKPFQADGIFAQARSLASFTGLAAVRQTWPASRAALPNGQINLSA
jgi:hypothetical protein